MDRTPLHDSLKGFEGTWLGKGRVFPNPFGPDGPTTGRWSFASDLGGFNLIHDYREERAGGQSFAGHGVLTVDPAAAEIVWFWFDSYGFPPIPHSRGRWDGPQLVLEKVTPRGTGRSVFTLGQDSLRYRAEVRLNGATGFAPVTEGTYHRSDRPA